MAPQPIHENFASDPAPRFAAVNSPWSGVVKEMRRMNKSIEGDVAKYQNMAATVTSLWQSAKVRNHMLLVENKALEYQLQLARHWRRQQPGSKPRNGGAAPPPGLYQPRSAPCPDCESPCQAPVPPCEDIYGDAANGGFNATRDTYHPLPASGNMTAAMLELDTQMDQLSTEVSNYVDELLTQERDSDEWKSLMDMVRRLPAPQPRLHGPESSGVPIPSKLTRVALAAPRAPVERQQTLTPQFQLVASDMMTAVAM